MATQSVLYHGPGLRAHPGHRVLPMPAERPFDTLPDDLLELVLSMLAWCDGYICALSVTGGPSPRVGRPSMSLLFGVARVSMRWNRLVKRVSRMWSELQVRMAKYELPNVLMPEVIHTDAVISALLLSPDGARISTGSRGHNIRIWSTDSFPLLHTLQGHTGGIEAFAFSASEEILYSSSSDMTIRVWSSKDGRLIQTLGESHPSGPTLSRNGALLYYLSSPPCMVRVWSTVDKAEICYLEGHSNSTYFQNLVLSSDERCLYASAPGCTVVCWSTQNHTLTLTIHHPNRNDHEEHFHSIALSPCGGTLYASTNDHDTGDCVIFEYSTADGQLRRKLYGHSSDVKSMEMSPDGRWLYTASSDRKILVWATFDHSLKDWLGPEYALKGLQGHRGSVLTIALAADGQTVFSSGEDSTLRIW